MKFFRSFIIAFLWLSMYGLNGNTSLALAQTADDQTYDRIDREYVLESTMIGYTGLEGSISGVLNPVLQAEPGDIVKITIVNGELMPHDIAMENLGISSEIILEAGATASIVFEAVEDDTYYCTIPGHRLSGMEGQFEVVESMETEQITGVSPRDNGRPLNVTLERGTLADWTAEGDAFTEASVRYEAGDWFEEETQIAQDGDYFVSSGGMNNHEATGTLTSVPFEVTHPWASFMVSGGALLGTRVELVNADSDEVFFMITGNGHATLRPVVVDLTEQMGEDMYIRLIDRETGASDIPYIPGDVWAHINFDDFRFYDRRPTFVNELRPEDIVILPMRDIVGNMNGLSGEDAAAAMDAPEGFSVTLSASEPDVVRPIAMAMDERGRVWVAEGRTYPIRAEEGEGNDRILIFEDTTGDGVFDKQTVFMEGLNLVSAMEVGFGGVWVGAAPYLMFIPMDPETDSPSGEPEILLDGWGYQDTHETLNSLTWGPDGWLYGAQGIFTHSNVGKPGAADEDRQQINAGIWRYHPTRDQFEVVAHGTSNPWGVAFNDYGHAFMTVCVVPHLFHVIPGARYQRQMGEHFNEHTYDDIKTVADHVHWVGDRGPHAGNFRSDDAGGGHAHAGAMFYLGNSHWGMDRDAIWMNNIHGYRVNTDHLERSGSGYTASHGEDFVHANDTWSQWLSYRIDPAGSVFAIDWYDKNQCHSPNPDVHDKSLGRIFKITHEKDEWVQVDLAQKTSLELVELLAHENEFYVQHARKLLQYRGADEQVHQALWEMFEVQQEIPRKLRALWGLSVTEALSESDLQEMLSHESEYIRGWAIQLLMDMGEPSDETLLQFADMAHNDNSAHVRLYLASALQKIDHDQRWDILEGIAGHTEDADDHNLPLMVWYAAEPLAEVDPERALDLAINSPLPNMVGYTTRRIAQVGSDQGLEALKTSLDKTENPDFLHTIQVVIDNYESD